MQRCFTQNIKRIENWISKNSEIEMEKSFYTLKLDPVEKLEEERAIIHFISTPDIDRGGDIVDPPQPIS